MSGKRYHQPQSNLRPLNGGGKQAQTAVQLNVKIEDLPPVVCAKEGCSGQVFKDAFRMRKVSALISPDGQDHYMRLKTAVCADCGTELPDKP